MRLSPACEAKTCPAGPSCDCGIEFPATDFDDYFAVLCKACEDFNKES